MKGFSRLERHADELKSFTEAYLTSRHDSATPSRGQWAAPPLRFTASLSRRLFAHSHTLLVQIGSLVAR